MEITDNMCCVAADIPTPCLVIDENRLEQNIRRIHDYAARHGFSIRPHVKIHKSLYITRKLWNPAYQALCRAGLAPETVSSGSSPSLFNTHLINHVNEIRVGTMYLNDYFELLIIQGKSSVLFPAAYYYCASIPKTL